MINWRRIRRKQHDKKRCNMVCQKALLRQIHDAGILSVEGVVGMDLIDKHNTIDAVNDAIAEYIPLMDGECIKIPLAIARAIMNMPSAKSNVIRCKDCKWWDKDEHSKRYGYCLAAKHCHYSFKWEIQIYRTYPEDFYCADAEPRKEEGEEE